MLKLIDGDSYFNNDEPAVTLIQIEGSTAHLVKKAEDQRVTEFISGLNPEKGKFYLHILAMGAGEYYGANRNHDYFPEEQLIKYHKTFEETGHVFRNHVNKDPAKSIGKVILSVYNERMHRVELIVEVDNQLGADLLERLESGDYPATSMACRTPYDKCSICGNEATSRQAYCSHLTSELGRIKPDGNKVMSLNVAPLRFFDISIVVKPADVTSAVLQKVASATAGIGSAENAEIHGLTEKTANLKKFSELIKEINSGNVVSALTNKIVAGTPDPSQEVLTSLSTIPLDHVLSGFIKLGISPSTKFLAELIAIQKFGHEAEGFGELADLVIKSTGTHDFELPEVSLFEYHEPHPLLLKILAPSKEDCSYDKECVEKRAGLGYNRFGAEMQQKEYEVPHQHEQSFPSFSQEQEHGLFKTLLGVGVSAMLAKYFISKEIERQLGNRKDNVKIVLLKQSMYNDYSQVKVGPVGQGQQPEVSHKGFLLKILGKVFKGKSKAAKTGQFIVKVVKTNNDLNKLSN